MVKQLLVAKEAPVNVKKKAALALLRMARQLRHHLGPFLTLSPALYHPTRAVWFALLSEHAIGC